LENIASLSEMKSKDRIIERIEKFSNMGVFIDK